MERHFVAALLKASQTRTPAKKIAEEAYNRGQREGYESGCQSGHAGRLQRELKSMEEKIKAFEESSGIALEDWGYNKTLGEALTWYRKNRIDHDADMLKLMGERFLESAKTLKQIGEKEC